MKVTKHIYSFLILIGFVLLFAASSSQREAAEPPPERMPMRFSFDPPTEGVDKSSDVSFVLVNPRFGSGFINEYNDRLISATISPWRDFARNMGNDFEEMLTARGYSFRSFESTEDLVYRDRTLDLMLEVEVELSMTGLSNARKNSSFTNMSGNTVSRHWLDGEVIIEGTINMIFSEPQTEERVRRRNIPIPVTRFHLETFHKNYNGPNIPIEKDPLAWNIVVENLQKIYNHTLQRAFDHLEPEDILVLKEEADEIKERHRFSR